MQLVLRIYTIRPGELDEWLAEWREQVVPLRRAVGFEVLGAWATEEAADEPATFTWLLGYEARATSRPRTPPTTTRRSGGPRARPGATHRRGARAASARRRRLMNLDAQLSRLARHSAVYGLGGVVSRVLAVFLLPLYTRYLDPGDLGAVGVSIALSAVLVTVLRGGISSAFFRFYFDSQDAARRLLVVRTSFWFTMASATLGLAAGLLLAAPIADAPRPRGRRRSSAPPSSASGRR